MAQTGTEWKRHNRTHPCPICRGDSWCQTSESGYTVCMRVADGGEEKESRNGDIYWVHSANGAKVPRNFTPPPEAPRADPDTLHEVYTAVLRALPLTGNYRKELLRRGLQPAHLAQFGYASMPAQGRYELARALVDQFGEDTCAGIPGWFLKEDTERGGSYPSFAGCVGIIIPVRDLAGRIISLNIRADQSGDAGKYTAVSSKNHRGAGPGNPLHKPLWKHEEPLEVARVTEGRLKADVATALSGVLTLGLPGVGDRRGLLPALESLKPQRVLLAFDADAPRNIHVARPLRDTFEELEKAGLELGFTVDLEVWDETQGKGIDDLLNAGGTPQVLTGDVARNTIAGTVAAAQRTEVEKRKAAGDPLADLKPAIDDLMVRVRTNPGAAQESTSVELLGLLKQRDVPAFANLWDELKKAGVMLSLLKPAVAKWMKEAAQRAGEATPDEALVDLPASEYLSDCPAPELAIPFPYALTDEATILGTADDEGRKHQHRVAYAPVVIECGVLAVDEGEKAPRLAWKGKGVWHSLIAKRSVVLNKNKVCELADMGFPVASSNAQSLVDYLHKLDGVNQSRLPELRTSSRLGWQGKAGDGGFLWGRNLILPSAEILVPPDLEVVSTTAWDRKWIIFRGAAQGDEQIASGFHQRGTLEDFLAEIAVIQNYPLVLAFFYAALAAPLLGRMRAHSFVIELANKTTGGKTVAQRVAASIFGNPDEQAPDSIIKTWNNTLVFLERCAAVYCTLPLFFDDTKLAKNPEMIGQMVYTLTSGQGRGRGTVKGLAETRHWNTITLSTGEQPITSFGKDGGAHLRCIVLTGPPFGNITPTSGAMVNKLNLGVMSNYGHLGPLFIQRLYENPELLEKLERAYVKSITHFESLPESRKDPNLAGRMARLVVAVSAAGWLAHKLLPIPWEYENPFVQLWGQILNQASNANQEDQALMKVYSWAASNARRFYPRNEFYAHGGWATNPPLQSWAGIWPKHDTWDHLSFVEHEMDRLLKELGYQPEAIYAAWKQNGYLVIPSSGATSRYKRQLTLPDKSRPYFVSLSRKAVEAVIGRQTDRAETEDSEEQDGLTEDGEEG